ncbi:hypothetical protein RhiJN_05181 [Ceratobasidium sp. AG-Ba]|nr:hypothetical protein RhiJN_05181 [Ceratobasidium sp. AG-Ba]
MSVFPDRVGRVVIGSVTDPVYWSPRPSYEFWGVSIQSGDDVFTGFVTNCAAAGPGNCALASNGSTPDSLKQDVQSIIDMAYDYKKTQGANGAFGSALVRSLLRKAMYEPTTWPAAAQSLVSVPELIKNDLNSSSPNASIKRSFETGMSLLPVLCSLVNKTPQILCGDSVDAANVTTKMVFGDIVRVLKEVSHMFGATWFSFHFCHRWPVRAVERYTGPFNKNLSSPVLVIGIEADPATPFVSAKRLRMHLGILQFWSSRMTMGTTATLGNYFRNGTLPPSGQFCATNQALFPGIGITNEAQGRTRWTVSSPIAGSALLLTLILPYLS